MLRTPVDVPKKNSLNRNDLSIAFSLLSAVGEITGNNEVYHHIHTPAKMGLIPYTCEVMFRWNLMSLAANQTFTVLLCMGEVVRMTHSYNSVTNNILTSKLDHIDHPTPKAILDRVRKAL